MGIQIIADAQLLMTLNIMVLAGVIGCGYFLYQMNAKLEELTKK